VAGRRATRDPSFVLIPSSCAIYTGLVRWAAVIAAIVVMTWTPRAHAIVIMEPPIVRACPLPGSWTAMTACLAKHGLKTRVVRTLATAKLLETGGDLVLFVETGGSWHLGGLLENASDYEVLGLETVVANHHTGYRVDLALMQGTSVSFDNATGRAGLRLTRSSLYCSGERYWCLQVTSACDVLLDGKTYSTFRGTVTIAGNELVNAGDRSAAIACSFPEREALGWPDR